MASPAPNRIDIESLHSRKYRPARYTLLPSRVEPVSSKPKRVPKLEPPIRAGDKEISRLVLQLVSHTHSYSKHLPDDPEPPDNILTPLPALSPPDAIDPKYHPVELGDWEAEIQYKIAPKKDGAGDTKDDKPIDAMEILKRPRNPYLDSLRLDETTVCWNGTKEDLLARAEATPLILELGVAGASIARQVFTRTTVSTQHPTPAALHEAYRNRMAKKDVRSSPVPTTRLHSDQEKLQAVIAARQKKRAQMAKDKTNRVLQVMGTVSLGGGRGRTITSSLMGPGGTERTGRPTRDSHTAHDAVYVEQLDLVRQHALVRDLSKVGLRQYHRPKLPNSVVRPNLPWQLQIKVAKNKKENTSNNTAVSYNAMVLGTSPGALSKTKIRNEADLTPTEGMLVLMEYMEEHPPMQLTKGMACKIVNFFRGNKERCPVSAGGGDRPSRRKRAVDAETTEVNKSAGRRLEVSSDTKILDWVGELPKKIAHSKERSKKEAVDVLPEGVTEILHAKVHGPFIGEVEQGQTITGLISNLFVAPMVRHEPERTDFLLILTPASGAARAGESDSMGVVLRDLPKSIFCVGQSSPRARVNGPGTSNHKNFLAAFVGYQVARALQRAQSREGRGLRFEELQNTVLPNLELPTNAIRQRLKNVAVNDKTTSVWTSKPIGPDYRGVEALGRAISPEDIAAFETCCAAIRRLSDLGIDQLYERGSSSVLSIGVAMVYLTGQLNAAKELARKANNTLKTSKTLKNITPEKVALYEKAAFELENRFKVLRQRFEVAQFIFEELQLAPWHLTGEFIDVHKKGDGSGMMRLTGFGDPTGIGKGFSFLREADSKPNKVGVGAGQEKKITGTGDDLRKLTMPEMGAILRKYGLKQKEIDTLRRWDRVHVIRDFSTKAASDGIGDGLERFARGEKMKLSEQKQMYRDRIQVIWRRQLASLAVDSTDTGDKKYDGSEPQKAETNADDDSDDDDYGDLGLEDEMMDRNEANQLVVDHATRGNTDGPRALEELRAATKDKKLTRDAQALAALRRQNEEQRATQEGLHATEAQDMEQGGLAGVRRKVIRKKITKTYPDGRQETVFKFILNPEEVGKIMARLQDDPGAGRRFAAKELPTEPSPDEKPPGHAMFEDEDDFEFSSNGRQAARRGPRRKRATGRSTPRDRNLHLGKLKTRVNKEDRMKKRKREEEELEVYVATSKRKGTSNRRERGSIRERRPHVIYAEKLEAIRAAVEARPYAGPFLKQVNSRLIPRYYEVISHPIDLQKIRERVSRYDYYKNVEMFLRDFELLKNNAIKFNGTASEIAQEAVAIYEFVKSKIDAGRDELVALVSAMDDQTSGKPKKPKKAKKSEGPKQTANTATVGGVEVNLGNLDSSSMHIGNLGSDSD